MTRAEKAEVQAALKAAQEDVEAELEEITFRVGVAARVIWFLAGGAVGGLLTAWWMA